MPARYCLALLFSGVLAVAQVPAPETGTVEGTVVHASTGQPVPGARVRLQRGGDDLRIQPADGELFFTTTDDQGRYRFTGLEFASYRLRAIKPGFLEANESARTVWVGGRLSLSAAHPHVELQVALRRYAVIAGRISDVTGLPLANAEVHLLGTAVPRPRLPSEPDSPHRIEELIRVTANDRGEYRLARLPPGTYYLEVRPGIGLHDDNTYHVTYYPRTLEIAAARPIDVAEGQTVRADVQIIQRRGFRVAGRLINAPQNGAGGPPGTYTFVQLAPANRAARDYSGPWVSTAEDRFELRDVLPGQYTLQAVTRLREDAMESRLPKAVLWARLPVVVGESDLEDIQVTLEPTFDLPGSVSFTAGCKAAPALIRVSALGAGLLVGSVTATSGEGGAFVIGGLVPGRYHLDQSRRIGMPWPVGARFDGKDVFRSGFEVAGATSGPLEVTMSCAEAGADR